MYDATPGTEDVLMVVEISDTSLAFDLSAKAMLYGRAGIAEYWVVDVPGRQLHRHTAPSPGGYARIELLTEFDTIAPGSNLTSGRTINELLAPAG